MENNFHTVECNNCGLIFINPRPTYKQVITRYNSEFYFNGHEGLYEDWLQNSEKKLSYLSRIEHGKNLLEIGCAKGHFLKFANKQGYKVTGIDISDYAINYIKSEIGFNVIAGEIHSIEFSDRFDVICFFDVLSHVYSPTLFFEGISKNLKNGGFLFARVGDKGGQWKTFRQGKWYAPDHLFHFSKELLKNTLLKNGLEIIETFPAFDSEYPYLFETFITDDYHMKSKIIEYNTVIHDLAINSGIMDDYYFIAIKK